MLFCFHRGLPFCIFNFKSEGWCKARRRAWAWRFACGATAPSGRLRGSASPHCAWPALPSSKATRLRATKAWVRLRSSQAEWEWGERTSGTAQEHSFGSIVWCALTGRRVVRLSAVSSAHEVGPLHPCAAGRLPFCIFNFKSEGWCKARRRAWAWRFACGATAPSGRLRGSASPHCAWPALPSSKATRLRATKAWVRLRSSQAEWEWGERTSGTAQEHSFGSIVWCALTGRRVVRLSAVSSAHEVGPLHPCAAGPRWKQKSRNYSHATSKAGQVAANQTQSGLDIDVSKTSGATPGQNRSRSTTEIEFLLFIFLLWSPPRPPVGRCINKCT